MAARLISDYIDSGLASARPAAPDIVAGSASFYYATDTGVLSVYNGSWTDVNAGSTAPTIRQRKIVTQADAAAGITLDSAPLNNSMLIAMCIAGTSSSPLGTNTAAGWRSLFSDTTLPDLSVSYRFCNSGSEPALQDPWSTTDTAVTAMWEVLNVAATYSPYNGDLDGTYTSGTITPVTDLLRIVQPGLLLGFTARRSLNLPSSITGAAAGPTVSASGLAGAMFDTDVPALSAPSIGITYGTSESTRRAYVILR